MESTNIIYTNPDETLAVTRVVALQENIKLLYTNIPNVVVKLTSFGGADELREILYISTLPVENVVGRGPSIRHDKRGVQISWSSGNAKSIKAMGDEIQVMRLAQWMAEEQLALYSGV